MSKYIVQENVFDYLVIDTEIDEAICGCGCQKNAQIIADSLNLTNSNNTTQTTIKIDENDGWIKWEWTEEKPYPLGLGVMVDVMFGDGEVFIQECDVNEWRNGYQGIDYWMRNDNPSNSIIAYQPSKQ